RIHGSATTRGASCTTNSDCAGPCVTDADCSPSTAAPPICVSGSCANAKCAFEKCTNAGCLFGPPLPIPNSSNGGAATSTCVVNVLSANASGSADCAAGSVTNLSLPLSSGIFLTGDLMPMRCSGGSNAGGNCTGSGGCGTIAAGTPCPGGSCVNDTGRCRGGNGQAANTPCCTGTDCTGSGTCETSVCAGGSNAG